MYVLTSDFVPLCWGPFIGRKTLTERQKEYNDVHGFYRARFEHLFACVWHWGIVRNIWRGSSTELHEYVRVLLHLQEFLIRRQVRYPPYGMAPTQLDNDTLFMAFPIVHDVCYVGKVVCHFLELGQFGSPNSNGVSKGCAWGLFRGNIV